RSDTADGDTPRWTVAIAENRVKLDANLNELGVHCRRFWFPIHTQQPYKESDDRFPNSTRMVPKAIWLPSAFQLSDDDIGYVCKLIRNFYE
ncbi:MAG: DegT/DnrJ/EryC1/StrS family aminotransferase, partial [Syntrophales bacterium LBB04]|nr:DegT/DnrJ/EryC1/StrS family aminotransferase [Syntrophales bacterium LBB04]